MKEKKTQDYQVSLFYTNSCFLLSDLQRLIHFLDIGIFNKCEIKLFLFGESAIYRKGLSFVSHWGTKITLSDYAFVFLLYLKMKSTSFPNCGRWMHLTINTAGQSVSFVPIYLSDGSSNTGQEPTKILLLTGALCPFWFSSWKQLSFQSSEFTWGHRPLNSRSLEVFLRDISLPLASLSTLLAFLMSFLSLQLAPSLVWPCFRT